MAYRAIRYHANYAPEGREFDLEQTSDDMLIEQGWVDSPAKIGVDVWQHEGSQAAVAKTKARYEQGMVAAVDKPDQPSVGQMEENERLRKELENALAQNEALRTEVTRERQYREFKEREADEKADAAKLMPQDQGRGPEDVSQVEKQMQEQASEAQLEQQQQDQAEAAEATDLAAQAGIDPPPGATDL